MFKGFYNLTSSMLTQNKTLNVISNNLANSSTNGYKADYLVAGTFQDEVLARTGNNTRNAIEPALGGSSMITVPYETITNHAYGGYESTGNALDFAVSGEGFFRLERDGETFYSRNGAFTIADDGTLILQGIGAVMDVNNQPIVLETDQYFVQEDGSIYGMDGELLAQINVAVFPDTAGLTKIAEGLFTAEVEPQNGGGILLWKQVEASNVDPIQEMTAMLVSQRSLQSAAQLLKIYDQMAAKASTEIGRV